MPNWVYNSVQISGTKEDLIAFRDKARKPAPSGFNSEDGTLTYSDKSEPLSFWNFIEPEDKALYFGASDYKPAEYEGWSAEERLAYSMKFSSNGWYDWNVREWGTKWDAGSVDTNDNTEDKAPYLTYSFETAWSIPEPVFTAMVRQHPTLTFDFESEEEQGWGATYTSSDGDDVDENGVPTKSLILVNEWDIPDCHEDYVSRGRDCWACESGDVEDLYEDCPRDDVEFAVVIQRTFMVKAQNAEQAWEIAEEQLSQVPFANDTLEQADEDFLFVKDLNTNKQIFPMDLTDAK
jgi:hypothetical protein